MKFKELVAEFPRRPPKTLVLEPDAFAMSWEPRPKDAVCFGIRTLSDAENTNAKGEAAKLAVELHESHQDLTAELYNDALMRFVVMHGLCDPNDYLKRPELLPLPSEPLFRSALTGATVRYLFNEIQALEVSISPVHDEGDIDDAEFLVDHLDKLGDSDQARVVRRYVRFAALLLSVETGLPLPQEL